MYGSIWCIVWFACQVNPGIQCLYKFTRRYLSFKSLQSVTVADVFFLSDYFTIKLILPTADVLLLAIKANYFQPKVAVKIENNHPGWGVTGFQADHFWFRNYQRRPALFQLWFSVVHYLKFCKHRWFSLKNHIFRAAESELFQHWFSLKQLWTALIFCVCRMTFLVQFSEKCFEVPHFRGTEFWFSAQMAIRREQQKFNLLTGQRYIMHSIFWVLRRYSNEEIDMVQVCRSIFTFSGLNCQDCCQKIWDFSVIQQNIGKIWTF